MVFNSVIDDMTILHHPFVFSQSYVQISTGVTDVRGLAVAVFDCSLSVVIRQATIIWFCLPFTPGIMVKKILMPW